MVHFVGAGCGAPDLITVRGSKLLSEADVIIYAGSLVNPALLEYAKEGCVRTVSMMAASAISKSRARCFIGGWPPFVKMNTGSQKAQLFSLLLITSSCAL